MTEIDWKSLRTTAKKATELLPDDWYDVAVVKTEAKPASTGAPMIKATLEVISGPYEGRRLFTQFVLSVGSGFALNRFFDNMNAFGITEEVFDTLPQGEAGMPTLANMLVDRTARAQVGKKEWPEHQDPKSYRNEIQSLAPAPNSGGPVVSGAPRGAGNSGMPPVPQVSSAPTSTPPVPQSAPLPSVPSAMNMTPTGATPEVGATPPAAPPLPF